MKASMTDEPEAVGSRSLDVRPQIQSRRKHEQDKNLIETIGRYFFCFQISLKLLFLINTLAV